MRRFEILNDRLSGLTKGDIVDEADFPGGEVGWLEHSGMVREVEPKPDKPPRGGQSNDDKGGDSNAG